MISGVLGNILTIIVIDRNKHIHNHLTPLLLNLAVGNSIDNIKKIFIQTICHSRKCDLLFFSISSDCLQFFDIHINITKQYHLLILQSSSTFIQWIFIKYVTRKTWSWSKGSNNLFDQESEKNNLR